MTEAFRPHAAQRPPDVPWRIWLFMGGRGAGKTRAGAEWVSAEVAAGRARRIALVGPTLGDVREVMIEGPSGLRAIAPEGARPAFIVSRRRLVWPDGRAEAYAFSAEDPDSLRGPQFDLAWCDEAGVWKRGEATWDTLRFGLRLGERPRTLVTTTPRPTGLVRRLLKYCDSGLAVMTRAASRENAANLAPGFVEELEAMYRGTRLARQELEGELVEDRPGALFQRDWIERGRVAMAPKLDRVVVAVDPPASAGEDSNACGIVAMGRAGETLYVLEDASAGGLAPLDWARRAAATARRWGAGRIVAEANQGGEMVRTMLAQAARGAGAPVRVELRHAGMSKRDRAEPVSGWMQSGEVRFAGVFKELEDELCSFGAPGGKSPDRMDALVWAACELMEVRRVGVRVRGV